MIAPGLFVGTLRHRRFAPVPHAFTYRTFMALLDVDRVPALMGASRLTGYGRAAWASFHESDHLGDPRLPLRARVAVEADRAGVRLPEGPIYLLTHLRYLGYCFNPVSFFYVFDADGRLRHVLAEVRNTFGGSHAYWLRNEAPARSAFHARAAKSLYVSPFLPVDLDYAFTLTPPRDQLVAHIEALRGGAPVFDATLSLERRPWSAREIRRQLVRQPAATMAVTAAIHWQALRLWWKGVPVVRRRTADGVDERAAWQRGTSGAAKEQSA